MVALRAVLLTAFVLGLGVSVTLSQTALAGLSLFCLWRLRDPAERLGAAWPLGWPVVAFGAVTILSALASGHAAESIVASKGLLLAAALYVTVNTLRTPEAADRFLSGLAVVAAAAAAVGLAQVAVCPGPDPDYGSPYWLYHRCFRARGFFSIYMTLAGVLTLALLATLPRVVPPAFHARLLPAWLVMLAGLAATYTRGAWVGFASGVLALLPTARRERWLLVGGLLVLGALALGGPQHVRQRLLSMGDPEDPTVKERVYMWRSAIVMWREHPWLGMGPGGVKREYRAYARPEASKQRTAHVHSTPLQILVERGVVGLAAWLWIWGAFYVHAIGVIRRLPPSAIRERALVAGSLAAITGFLVGGLSEYNFGDAEVVLVAWTVTALPFVVARGERTPRDRSP